MKNSNIVTGSIWKNMLAYFWTLMLGAFFQQFYNTVDAIIVGRAVGSGGLAAVAGSSAMVVNLFLGFFLGLSSGATVVISQFYGAGRKEEVEKTVHTAIALAITGGLVLTVVGVAISHRIIVAMNTPADTVEASTMYLRIYFLGMIPNLIYNMGAGILRAVGDSKRPLIILVISCFTNVFLDILFVIVFGMGKRGITTGVMGVALATILCQLLSAVIVVRMLGKTDDSYKLDIRHIRFDRQMLIRIISIGLPAGFQSTMYTFSNILIQTSINEFGTDTASAWGAYGKIDVLFWMMISSLGTTATTFAGQNFGAGKYDRVRKTTRQAFIIATAITIPLSLILCLKAEFFYKIFINPAVPGNGNVIDIGVQMVEYLAPFYVTYIGVEIFSGVLRGMGDAFMPMVITMSGICLLRAVWILVAFPLNRTVTMVEASYPITWITTSVLFLIYYLYFVRKRNIR